MYTGVNARSRQVLMSAWEPSSPACILKMGVEGINEHLAQGHIK